MFTFLPLLIEDLIVLLDIHLDDFLLIDLVLDLDLLSPPISKIVLYNYNNIFIYIYIYIYIYILYIYNNNNQSLGIRVNLPWVNEKAELIKSFTQRIYGGKIRYKM